MILRPYTGIISAADQMNSVQKESFKGGYKVFVLPVGFQLWRFVSTKTGFYFSDFWMDQETMRGIMSELHTSNTFSQEFKKTNIRNSLAILEQWSMLNWRLKIVLQKEVIAFVGQTGKQKGFEDSDREFSFGAGKTEKLRNVREGGHLQYVIPRFKGLPNVNNYAKVEKMVHI